MVQSESRLQSWFNKNVWNTRSSALENPNQKINGYTIDEIIGSPTKSTSGETVNADTALTFSAVHRAQRLICDIVAYLPINVIETDKDGDKHIAYDDPTNFLISKEVSPAMSSFNFREAMQANLNFGGDAFAEIVSNGAGQITKLQHIPYWNVEVKLDRKTFDPVYIITLPDGTKRDPLPAYRMIHIPGFGFDGQKGLGVIEQAAQSLGTAIAMDKYAGEFFANSASPGGILTNEGANETQQKLAKSAFLKAVGRKGKRHGIAVMPGGWKYSQTTLPPDQAQFLQSRQFSVVEVARWFGVPPHLLFDLTRSTYSNIEHQGIEFLLYTMNGIFTRWEAELNRKLFNKADRVSGSKEIKFDFTALLMTDMSSRMDFLKGLWTLGAYSTNDVLKELNKNKVEGGDQRFVQQGFMPLDKVDQYAPNSPTENPQKQEAEDA